MSDMRLKRETIDTPLLEKRLAYEEANIRSARERRRILLNHALLIRELEREPDLELKIQTAWEYAEPSRLIVRAYTDRQLSDPRVLDLIAFVNLLFGRQPIIYERDSQIWESRYCTFILYPNHLI